MMVSSASGDRRPRRIDSPRFPGDLVQVSALAVNIGANRGWTLRYCSTGVLGAPILVTGTLLVPTAPWRHGRRPIIVYSGWVYGLGAIHGPSVLLGAGGLFDIEPISSALARGWAVAISDGERPGINAGSHPYLAGRSAGYTVLDMARAAVQTPDSGLSVRAPVGLWGYSEGGRAVAWAAELQSEYCPDVPVKVVVAGGVPADLTACIEAIDGGPYSGLGLAALIGLSTAHPDTPIQHLLSPAGQTAIRQAEEASLLHILTRFRNPLRRFTILRDPWNDPAWAAVLLAEENGHHQPRVPVYLYHGTHDEVVPIRVAQQLYADYRVRGSEVTWLDIPGANHAQGAEWGARAAVDHLAAHLEPLSDRTRRRRVRNPPPRPDHGSSPAQS